VKGPPRTVIPLRALQAAFPDLQFELLREPPPRGPPPPPPPPAAGVAPSAPRGRGAAKAAARPKKVVPLLAAPSDDEEEAAGPAGGSAGDADMTQEEPPAAVGAPPPVAQPSASPGVFRRVVSGVAARLGLASMALKNTGTDPLPAMLAAAGTAAPPPPANRFDSPLPGRINLHGPSTTGRTVAWSDDGVDEIEDDDAPAPVPRLPAVPAGAAAARAPLVALPSPASPGAARAVTGTGRRKTARWEEAEVEALMALTTELGRANWARKLAVGLERGVFSGRTQVDLKDKWRNLEKAGRV